MSQLKSASVYSEMSFRCFDFFPFKTKKINCTHFLEYVGRLYSIESDNLMRKRFVRERILAMIVIITKMASVELVSIIYTKYAIIISLSMVYSASITSIS